METEKMDCASAEATDEEASKLLEKVFLRFGSATTDEELETVLNIFLLPILDKLTNNKIRPKVLELLVHVNKRIKSRPLVPLPLDALLIQYNDTNLSSFVANFTIIYIKQGYPRLSEEKQAELLPLVLSSLESKPRSHQDSLLQMILPVLGFVKIPESRTEAKVKYGLEEKPVCLNLFLDHCLNFLLLPYAVLRPPPENAPPPPPDETPPVAPPGLSFATYRRLFGQSMPSAEEIENCKVGIIKFLSAQGLYNEVRIAIHFIVAFSDSRHRVVTAADKEIKRILGSVDMDAPIFVEQLFKLYLGSAAGSKQQTPETTVTPANTRMRLKLLPYLLRSKAATNHSSRCLQIVFDSLFGTNANQKLRTLALQFVHHISKSADEEKFVPIAPLLLSGMNKFMGHTVTDLKLRQLTYLAIGNIARRSPKVVVSDMTLLNNLFAALSQEETETRQAVQETLSMLSDVVGQHMTGSNLLLLESLLMENIEKEDSNSRLMAVHYASAVFPGDHVPSRYILLLAAGDLSDDIRTKAVKALDYRPQSDSAIHADEEKLSPKFCEMVPYILEKSNLRMKTNNKFILGARAVAFSQNTYTQLVNYLRQCLLHNATVDLEREPHYGPKLGQYVQELYATQSGASSIHGYVQLLSEYLSIFGGNAVMFYLLEIIAVNRSLLAHLLIEKLDWISSLMSNGPITLQENAAQLLAIVLVTKSSSDQIVQKLQAMLKNLDNKNEEIVGGALLGIAFTIGRLFLYGKTNCPPILDDSAKRSLDVICKTAVSSMYKNISSVNTTLRLSALTSLGELSRCTGLPIPNETENENEVSKLSLTKKLVTIVQATKEPTKIREKAALTLSLFSVGQPDFPYKRKAIDGMIFCAGPQQLDLHFSVGEALVNVALADYSHFSRDSWTVNEADLDTLVQSKGSDDELIYLIAKLLERSNEEDHTHKQQALCIWLLSIVKQCGVCQNVQNNVNKIQLVFIHMLRTDNEVTQDIASKGLGTLYEVCDEKLKQELVQLLIRNLTTGQTDNANLCTYKELCAIATDLNQPDLVYKLMHLANTGGIWTKKGAHLGFGNIAKQAADQLLPKLDKLVPKLYRYRYEPNTKIQAAMISVWAAVAPDTKATVDKYLLDIILDLVNNMTSGKWRVRESSCLAVADLLRGRNLEEHLDQLPNLWNTCFKVRDDMKESVRNAAETSLRSLSRLTVTLCEANNGKLGEQATELVLPPLLENGLLSSCKEVRAIGLDTLLKVSKNAGSLLKPHIAILVSALLESLSGLEPEVGQYISLHAGNDEGMKEKLDTARISMSKSSPMMETINMCSQYVDEKVTEQLIPRLLELIRGGIGIVTKAGVASYIVSLIQNDSKLIAPFAGKLMSALLTGLSDKSVAINKCYATTLSHVARIAKPSSTEKLVAKLKSWYLEKDDQQLHTACGATIYGMIQNAPDVVQRHCDVILPLAFLAMHGKDATIWTEIWQEATPGTEAGIKAHLATILDITKIALMSQSWPMKAQAATAIITVVDKSRDRLEQPFVSDFVQLLISGLSGRTWDGKETLLQAYKSLCVACNKTILETNNPTPEAILSALYRECKKEKITYKLEALKSYAEVAVALDIDKFDDVYVIIQPIIDKREKEEEENEEEEMEKEAKDVEGSLVFEEGALKILAQVWPKNESGQAQFADFAALLTASLKQNTWKLQIQTMKTMLSLWERLVITESNCDAILTAVSDLVSPVCKCIVDMKYAAVRVAALDLTTKILDRLEENDLATKLPEKIVSEVYDSLDSMLVENRPAVLEKVDNIRQRLRVLLDKFESQKDEVDVEPMDIAKSEEL